jgi:hypothetical protein
MFRLLLPVVLLGLNACAQPDLPYDPDRLSSEPAVRIAATGTRGLALPNGAVIYVEDDLRTLSAYNAEDTLWQVDVGSSLLFITDSGDTIISGLEPSILKLMYDGRQLHITFAKHCYGTVQLSDGTLELNGCD